MKPKLDRDFTRRARAARGPLLSKDVWSNNAADMVRMAIFAGFDAETLIRACLVYSINRQHRSKITTATVERILTAYTAIIEENNAEGRSSGSVNAADRSQARPGRKSKKEGV